MDSCVKQPENRAVNPLVLSGPCAMVAGVAVKPFEFPADFRQPETALGWVEEFRAWCPPSPWGIDGHAWFAPVAAASSDVALRSEHLLIGFGIHGNEWGTLPAAVALVRAFVEGHLRALGPVSILLGNLEALAAEERFLDEDFNRVFSFDRPAHNRERKRAQSVRPLLDAADLFLDFHQTQTPTEFAFWTFPWSEELGNWARVIGAAPRALTRAPGGAFSVGKKCLDEYVRDRGKVGITAELGESGPSVHQARSAYDAAVRLIAAFDEVCVGRASLADLAERSPPIEWYETVEVVAPSDPAARLRPGLCCFTPVAQGEVLSAPGAPLLVASRSAVVMFPKYPEPGRPMPPELLRLAVRVDDPRQRYG